MDVPGSLAEQCDALREENLKLARDYARVIFTHERLKRAFVKVSHAYEEELRNHAISDKLLGQVEQAKARIGYMQWERDWFKEELATMKREHPPPHNEPETDTEPLDSPCCGRKRAKQ